MGGEAAKGQAEVVQRDVVAKEFGVEEGDVEGGCVAGEPVGGQVAQREDREAGTPGGELCERGIERAAGGSAEGRHMGADGGLRRGYRACHSEEIAAAVHDLHQCQRIVLSGAGGHLPAMEGAQAVGNSVAIVNVC